MVVTVFAAGVVAAPAARQTLDVDVGVQAASTARLGTGTLVGSRMRGVRRSGPLSLGFDLAIGLAEEPDLRFEVRHLEIRAQGVGGWWFRRGAGAIGFELGVGGIFVQERRLGHARVLAGPSDRQDVAHAWATGLLVSTELQASVTVFRALYIKMGAGPTWAFFPATADSTWGWSVVGAIGWAFGG